MDTVNTLDVSKLPGLSYPRLVEFLYLLMRDAAPTGEVVRIVRMIAEGKEDVDVQYTSQELAAYAMRLAQEMTK